MERAELNKHKQMCNKYNREYLRSLTGRGRFKQHIFLTRSFAAFKIFFHCSLATEMSVLSFTFTSLSSIRSCSRLLVLKPFEGIITEIVPGRNGRFALRLLPQNHPTAASSDST